MSQLDEFGHEIFDQTPVSVGIHFERPTPLHIRIRNQILQMMHEQALSDETESFEDADDFEVDDDPVPYSPYEFEDDFDHIDDKKWKGAGDFVPSNGATAKQEPMTDTEQSASESGSNAS